MLGISNTTRNIERHIKSLIENNYIGLMLPDKPRSSKQQYYTTREGLDYISLLSKKQLVKEESLS